jgi:outer membrane assembly lipoprotein YfiO
MMRRLGLLLAVLMGPAVMVGYAFQEPPKSSEDRLEQARKKIIDLNYELMQSPDRSQKYTLALNMEQAIREFLRQYPDSDFAPAAKQCLKDAEENLALGNFRIAQFYAGRGNYVGAISRLKTIIEKYPNFSRIDEVNKMYETLSTAKRRSQSPQENAN